MNKTTKFLLFSILAISPFISFADDEYFELKNVIWTEADVSNGYWYEQLSCNSNGRAYCICGTHSPYYSWLSLGSLKSDGTSVIEFKEAVHYKDDKAYIDYYFGKDIKEGMKCSEAESHGYHTCISITPASKFQISGNYPTLYNKIYFFNSESQ